MKAWGTEFPPILILNYYKFLLYKFLMVYCKIRKPLVHKGYTYMKFYFTYPFLGNLLISLTPFWVNEFCGLPLFG